MDEYQRLSLKDLLPKAAQADSLEILPKCALQITLEMVDNKRCYTVAPGIELGGLEVILVLNEMTKDPFTPNLFYKEGDHQKNRALQNLLEGILNDWLEPKYDKEHAKYLGPENWTALKMAAKEWGHALYEKPIIEPFVLTTRDTLNRITSLQTLQNLTNYLETPNKSQDLYPLNILEEVFLEYLVCSTTNVPYMDTHDLVDRISFQEDSIVEQVWRVHTTQSIVSNTRLRDLYNYLKTNPNQYEAILHNFFSKLGERPEQIMRNAIIIANGEHHPKTPEDRWKSPNYDFLKQQERYVLATGIPLTIRDGKLVCNGIAHSVKLDYSELSEASACEVIPEEKKITPVISWIVDENGDRHWNNSSVPYSDKDWVLGTVVWAYIHRDEARVTKNPPEKVSFIVTERTGISRMGQQFIGIAQIAGHILNTGEKLLEQTETDLKILEELAENR